MASAKQKSAGYSGTPLIKKLGIKEGFRCFFCRPPSNFFETLGALPDGVRTESRLSGQFDFIHAFFEDTKSCEMELAIFQAHMKKSGSLWASWRKGKVSDLSENTVRSIGLNAGLVDVKVCAVDDLWSGLKFVFRVHDR
jgi:hypothetical protein